MKSAEEIMEILEGFDLRLVPTHRLGLRDHIEIQRPPRRLGQRANPADLCREVVHPPHHLLKDTVIDLTGGTL